MAIPGAAPGRGFLLAASVIMGVSAAFGVVGCAVAQDVQLSNTHVAAAAHQRFLKTPSVPKIIAENYTEVDNALVFSRNVAANKERPKGSRWIESAQIGLIYGAPEGQAYLAAPQGRALVRGEPAEQCPALEVGIASNDLEAARLGLESCFRTLAGYADCGCRVMAQGDRILAPQDEFSYAIGVAARLRDPDTGLEFAATAEERVVEGRSDARHLWILGPAGPIGLMQTEKDGRAALMFGTDGARYDGRHFSDGMRRGRIVRRAYLTGPNGRRLVVLIGYEDEEIKESEGGLLAWTPQQTLYINKAENR